MNDHELIWEDPVRNLLWEPDANETTARALSGKAGRGTGSALKRLALNCRAPRFPKSGRLPAEMGNRELAFLCGLLRKKHPEKVLEVGVAAGATSALVLKALSLIGSSATLHSVDLFTAYYRGGGLDTGYIVGEKLPELRKNWDLRTGRGVSAFIESIGGGIDFCILDTVHRLPGELLDFLAVLPYLKNDAIVIVHDTQLHLFKPEFPTYATCALLSVVAAEKIILKDDGYRESVANIAAFVVTEDTRKYIANVFSALMLPWAYIPDDDILNDVLAEIGKHYPPSYIDYFKRAANLNVLAKGGCRMYETDEVGDVFLAPT